MSMSFRPVTEADVPGLVALWRECGLVRPWNPPESDIAAFRAHPAAEILVAGPEGGAAASVAVGYDGHRGWIYYLAVRPADRGRGLGRAALAAAEEWLAARDVPKAQLMVRESNPRAMGFYARSGYADARVRVMQKWLDDERAMAFAEAPDGH